MLTSDKVTLLYFEGRCFSVDQAGRELPVWQAGLGRSVAHFPHSSSECWDYSCEQRATDTRDFVSWGLTAELRLALNLTCNISWP